MLHTGYNPSLVALSIAIAVLASYTALDLGARVRGAAPGPRWAWVGAASFSMGGGIWAMHFVGMLALEMAMPVLYGVRLTLLSFLIAVGTTGAAFAWVSRPDARPRDVLLSGPLMGVGVAAFIGYGEMLKEEVEDGAESASLVGDMDRIEGNARHLLGLINDVLDLSKVESGKMEVYAEAFDVSVVFDEVASAVEGLVAKKGNRLVLNVAPGGLGTARSDAVKLRQVLLNLLGNAAKFTEGGTITLSAAREAGRPDWLVFSVSDTNIGMTEEQVGQLFQRFHQADASTTRKFGGTGLGLALSKAFGTMLGGDLTVHSTPGRGSIFTVRVPATYAVEKAVEREAA